MIRLFLFLPLLFVQSITAQQSEIFKLKKYETAVFSDVLKENSGLTFFNGKLYTFNDGGNTSDIFEINPQTAQIEKTIPTNLKNIDWEAAASDSVNIYIGEIGNNAGMRRDLRIYKIPMDNVDGVINANSISEIPFYYPEQNDFSKRNINNDFDSEAMIFINGKIHLFTKEWVSRAVSHYVIDPNISENQPAQKIEAFEIGYVVTDAEYFEGKLYLIGYTKKSEVFLSIFDETTPGIFFENKPKKYYLGSSVKLGQVEGIAVDHNGVYISGEQFINPLGKAKPRLYFVPHAKFM